MKYLTFALCLLLASCDGSDSHSAKTADKMPWSVSAAHFDYKGHQYIMFHQSDVDARTQSIVHNPDCIHCVKRYNPLGNHYLPYLNAKG